MLCRAAAPVRRSSNAFVVVYNCLTCILAAPFQNFNIQGLFDVLIVSSEYVDTKMSEETPRRLLLWLFMARVHGYRVATKEFLLDRNAASLQFAKASSRKIVIHPSTRWQKAKPLIFNLLLSIGNDPVTKWIVLEKAVGLKDTVCRCQCVLCCSIAVNDLLIGRSWNANR